MYSMGLEACQLLAHQDKEIQANNNHRLREYRTVTSHVLLLRTLSSTRSDFPCEPIGDSSTTCRASAANRETTEKHGSHFSRP